MIVRDNLKSILAYSLSIYFLKKIESSDKFESKISEAELYSIAELIYSEILQNDKFPKGADALHDIDLDTPEGIELLNDLLHKDENFIEAKKGVDKLFEKVLHDLPVKDKNFQITRGEIKDALLKLCPLYPVC